MSQTTGPQVSRYAFSIAYAGDAREHDHTIDAEILGPALMGFGRLIREANSQFNGKQSKAKVLVVSDFENKCFNVNFEAVVSLYEQIRAFIDADTTETAKTVLEWLGLLGLGGGASGLTYLGYLRWKRGRRVTEVQEIKDQTQSGLVTVKVEGDGDNKIEVHNHVYNLSENPKALRATRDALSPVGREGFDRLELRSGEKLIDAIAPIDADSIISSCVKGIEQAKETEPLEDEFTAWLSVYSPVYDSSETAPNWRFRMNRDVIYADISDTDIAAKALERGGALADDTYQVKMRMTAEVDAAGKQKPPQYKVLEVLRFLPAEPVLQASFPFQVSTPMQRVATKRKIRRRRPKKKISQKKISDGN